MDRHQAAVCVCVCEGGWFEGMSWTRGGVFGLRVEHMHCPSLSDHYVFVYQARAQRCVPHCLVATADSPLLLLLHCDVVPQVPHWQD
jgi:hypothetical protein